MPEPMDPDCRAGKHRACAGHAWDENFDHIVDCACECHQKPEGGESLADATSRLRAGAERIGAAGVLAGLDQLDKRLSNERGRVLGEHFQEPEGGES